MHNSDGLQFFCFTDWVALVMMKKLPFVSLEKISLVTHAARAISPLHPETKKVVSKFVQRSGQFFNY
jgi:hypothetical protein